MKAITVSGKFVSPDCFKVRNTKTVMDDGKTDVDEWNTITNIIRIVHGTREPQYEYGRLISCDGYYLKSRDGYYFNVKKRIR